MLADRTACSHAWILGQFVVCCNAHLVAQRAAYLLDQIHA